MNLKSTFNALCLPSKIYLVLSLIAILLTVLAPAIFGAISILIHVVHLVYILFWTWVLQLICKAGYKWISWVLVLAPFVAALLLITLSANGLIGAESDGLPVMVVVSNRS